MGPRVAEARPVCEKGTRVWAALGGEFVEQTWERPDDTGFEGTAGLVSDTEKPSVQALRKACGHGTAHEQLCNLKSFNLT